MTERLNVRQMTLEMSPGEVGPRRGDYLVAIGRDGRWNSRYRVLIVRPVKRRDATAAEKYSLVMRRLDPEAPLGGTHRVLTFHWNSRAKKRKTFESQLADAIKRRQHRDCY